MLSIYLSSRTCIYLSLAVDNGVPMTSKRREKSQFHVFFFLVMFFFCHSYFFLVVSWKCALQVVVAVVMKEKCNSPRELGRGRSCPFVPAFRL